MVFVYDETRLITMFIKIFVASFFFFMSVRVKKKNPKYILNRFFSWAFISWGLYVLIDAFVYIILPLGETQWYIAQVLYGIEYDFLFSYAFLLLNAVKIIRGGSVVLRNKKQLFFELFFLVAFATLIIAVTRAGVLVGENLIPPSELPLAQGAFTLTEGVVPMTLIGSAIPFLFYGYAVYLLIGVIKEAGDPETKRKMKLMVIGILLIPVGILYFVFRGMTSDEFSIGSSIIGQLFFISAPIFINAALSRKK